MTNNSNKIQINKARFLETMRNAGFETMADASRAMGRSESYIKQVVSRGWMHDYSVQLACKVFGCSVDDLQDEKKTENDIELIITALNVMTEAIDKLNSNIEALIDHVLYIEEQLEEREK